MNAAKRLLSGGGAFLLCLALGLAGLNVLGWFWYREVSPNDPNHIPRLSPGRHISAAEFWDAAPRQPGETDGALAARLNELVNARMVHIDPRFAKPTLAENWIIWLHAQRHGSFEWKDSARCVRLGGGFCSQHAILLNNLLQENGIPSRFLTLNGHVLNEVSIAGRWRVQDSDFNVVFDESLEELESNPQRVRQVYADLGLPERHVEKLVDAFSTRENNHRYESAEFNPALQDLEQKAVPLVWLIPLALGLSGTLALFGARRLPAAAKRVALAVPSSPSAATEPAPQSLR